MLDYISLAFVVAVKVFKKTTPNGKITVYLGKRDFIDHMDYCDPVDGVVVVDTEYLKGRKIYSQLVTTYRYGREEDEVMGVKFSKEMVIGQDQVVPMINSKMELTPVQEKLLKKLGPNAFPFTFNFPEMAPSSVTLQPAEEDQGKPMGVEYCVRTYVAENEDQKSHKRSSVTLAIKKLQHAPSSRGRRLPSSLVSKGFTFSNGKINLEVTLDREIYYHGEKIAANIIVSNNSRKAVRNIRCMVVQHVEITMINSQFSRHVASLESREGCPITPGASLSKTFYLVPLARSNKDIRGVALDGHLKEDDVNLASSTLVVEGKCPADAIGIVVSYSVRVKLNCGTLGGELVTDVPFKLLHPAEGTVERQRFNAMKKMQSIERHRYENSLYTNEEEDNIVFEDFARLRMNEPE
ncbi:arrestin homolog [Hyposmocoma kahamanoa]|uniref:arrestin homolog n=1 Tax=Hyposmocoma kahamanoa TaxID=1477025 RepID=UPI000E6D8411|nr:arrestin homolog [Hyposmocoma kahamanoa]